MTMYLKNQATREFQKHVWVGQHFPPAMGLFQLLIELGILKQEKLSVIRSNGGVYVHYIHDS